jgi:hypothetical protein
MGLPGAQSIVTTNRLRISFRLFVLIVNHILAWLPERFSGPDDALRLTFQLETASRPLA